MSQITRRTFIGTASAAAVAVRSTASAHSDELTRLIEAHRAAYDAFVKAMDRLSEVEDAYEEAYPEPVLVPILPGSGGYEIKLGNEECRKHIARAYRHRHESVRYLDLMAPDLAGQVRAALDVAEAENMALVDRVFADEDARKEAFGLAASKRTYDDASAAEDEASTAVCAYRCLTIEEAAIKADYLTTQEMLRDGLQDHQVEALLSSFRIEGGS